METLSGVLLAIGWIGGFVFARILTTFIHEMGHAVPALAFTNKEVQIHIGSYGDEENSSHFTVGRLKTFFKFDFSHWNIGLCKHQGATKYWKKLLIVLGGPAFSLLIGIVLLFLMRFGKWSDLTQIIFTCFIISSIWDFIVNIVPSKNPIIMNDGSIGFNDGTLLMMIIQEGKLPPSYFEAINFCNEKKFDQAISSFKDLIETGHDKKNIRLLLVENLTHAKKYNEAIDQVNILFEKKQIETYDFHFIGYLQILKGDFSNSVISLNKYLYKNFQDVTALTNRGYSYIQLGEYEKAIHDFNSAIIHDPKFAHAYNNRVLAKIRLGQTAEGFADINKSKSLDDSNAYVDLHLGYYFQKINEIEKAHKHFQKAKEMEIDFHGIDYLIETTRENDF
jgi:tetratricopeptide (TPR) repeat protein